MSTTFAPRSPSVWMRPCGQASPAMASTATPLSVSAGCRFSPRCSPRADELGGDEGGVRERTVRARPWPLPPPCGRRPGSARSRAHGPGRWGARDAGRSRRPDPRPRPPRCRGRAPGASAGNRRRAGGEWRRSRAPRWPPRGPGRRPPRSRPPATPAPATSARRRPAPTRARRPCPIRTGSLSRLR